ncbi:MAG: FAD-dependent oxidoreductase [Deltaproteobacteria bacterium]|nr:FAD-dependent oxidoreductase [Deltaproteobacteria bacterium]
MPEKGVIVSTTPSSQIKEITFISIGGQGALVSSEILVSAMIMEGKIARGSVFIATGERRNSPVINHIKVSDSPPLPNCRNYMTNEMVVFKETLLGARIPLIVSNLQTLRNGILMVNSSKAPHLIEFPFDFEGTVATVDAQTICQEALGILPPPFGITLLGMYVAVTRIVNWQSLEAAIRGRFPGQIGEKNIEAARRAMAQTRIEEKRRILGKEKRQSIFPIPLEEVPSVERYVYKPLPSVSQGSYRIWRESLPVCDTRLCFCDECVSASYCPEALPVLTDKGFWTDYGFCKGCGICARECPHGAIRMVPLSTPPCQFSCPIGQDVPGYIALIAEKRYQEALELIREKNPLPGICGRICHHPCEVNCRRTDLDEALAIRSLKRFATEKAMGDFPAGPSMVSTPGPGAEVAVVGAGPAGLAAAYHLARMGHRPTIFEASSRPGGMLINCIPDFVLPPSAIESDINYIRSLGVAIRTKITVGQDLSLRDIREQGFKAVFLATGAPQSISLAMPGADLEGVLLAIPFLEVVKAGKMPGISGRIVVIGGGNVAFDCARTAVRLGAKEVHVTCLETWEGMPAYRWEIDAASREGVEIHPSLAPQKIIGRSGKVNSVELMRVESFFFEKKGGMRGTWIQGARPVYLRADRVIVAIGQKVDSSFLSNNLGLQLNENGTVKVNPLTQQTSLPAVFAGGDVITGSTSVVEAMAGGERAARAIDRFLGGPGMIPEKVRDASRIEEIVFNLGEIEEKDRIEPMLKRLDSPVGNFREIECTYLEKEAQEEAHRCTRCDLRGEFNFWARPVEFAEGGMH